MVASVLGQVYLPEESATARQRGKEMSRSRNPNVFGFGKYKGHRLTDPNVPEDYLCWVANNLPNVDPHLRLAIDREIERRLLEQGRIRYPDYEPDGSDRWEPKLENIPLALLRTDGGTQVRERIDRDVVQDYAARIALDGPLVLPPVVAFFDGETYWLADGYHRLEAHQVARFPEIRVQVQHGSCRDAILYACGANETHGLRRSNADKRRAVRTLLEDDEWGQWSDREVARRCAVSPPLVALVREQLQREKCQREEAERIKAERRRKKEEKKAARRQQKETGKHAAAHLPEFTDAPTPPATARLAEELIVRRGNQEYRLNTSRIGQRQQPKPPSPLAKYPERVRSLIGQWRNSTPEERRAFLDWLAGEGKEYAAAPQGDAGDAVTALGGGQQT
jgi:uncharacterized protein (DUF3820 family)